MDTGRIKQFATESRKILKEGVMQRIRALGFDEQGRTPDVPEKVQGGTRYQGRMIENERFYDSWVALNEHIRQVGVKAVYEEAAYTWFNRLIAIRIMQKNDFIEPVLVYDNPEIRVPHIVSEARRGNKMCRLTPDEEERLRHLLMDDTNTQEQFALLMIAYCRENRLISKCFGGIAPYLELLLPDDILSQNRFIDLLNNTSDYITDEQFRSAELIGWLYQFYISEKKDEVFASFKKGRKAEAEDIPAATQIFTPNWIVKYMVQNTVGRIYLDNNPYCPLKKDWRYLVEPTDKTPKEAILNIDNLEDLTLADLACGSGHILVEGFDLLYSLYIDEGYSRYDAVKNIFTRNLTGIDLDTRAKQLATFALLLKAAQVDKTFLDGEIMPRVYDMPDVNRYTWRDLNGHMTCALQIEGANEQVGQELDEAFTLMEQAQNLGSIMKFNISEPTRAFLIECISEQARQHKFEKEFADLFHGFHIILALTEKYAALAMNPPYMGSGNMNAVLSDYVKKNYEEGKADLFSTFMLLAIDRLADKGKYGMINMHSWMFLSSFEKLRRSLLDNEHIDSLLHLGPRTFDELSGEVVQNAAFIISKACVPSSPKGADSESEGSELGVRSVRTNSGTYFRLVDGKNCGDKERMFLDAQVRHTETIVYSNVEQGYFEVIPGWPLGYWLSNNMRETFTRNRPLSAVANPCVGLQTADNGRFLRSWFEVNPIQIGLHFENAALAAQSEKKWFPYNKGGGPRKWYGNQEYIVNWKNDGEEIRNFKGSVVRNPDTYFKPSVSWSKVSTASIAFRYFPDGFIYDVAGTSLFFKYNEQINYGIGLVNSKVSDSILKIFPTMNYEVGQISTLPFAIIDDTNSIDESVKNNISISKLDWNSHETSWDFEANPLVALRNEKVAQGNLESSFRLSDFVEEFEAQWTERFMQLHENEEELNRQFIEIYGLQDELTPDVPLDEITILQQGEITIE